MPTSEMTVGIVGGMGSLAAAEFFRAMVRAFPAEKEWDRPRIVVDNACQMPSRVRALLYGERRQELVEQLARHMAGLVRLGCTDIVLCCNTSHVFLPEVLPLAEALCEGRPFTLRHILRILAQDLLAQGVKRVSLIATEGTLAAGIYPQILGDYGIAVECEGESAYGELRFLIEAVKRDEMGPQAVERFCALLCRQPCRDVVLGCTEFPLLRERLGPEGEARLGLRLFDPLQATVQALKRDYFGNGRA